MRARGIGRRLLTVALAAGLIAPALAQTATETTVPEQALNPADEGRREGGSWVKSFAEIGYLWQRDTRPGRIEKDRITQATAGLEFALAPWLGLTTGLSVSHLDRSKLLPLGSFKSDSATVFVGTTVYFINDYSFNVTAGLGKSYIEESRAAGPTLVLGDKRATSRFVASTFSGAYYFDRLRVAPFVQFLYSDNLETRGFETDGRFRKSSFDTLGRASVGTEVSYSIPVGDFTFDPVVRAAFNYDVNLLRDYHDRTAFELSGGFNLNRQNLSIAARVTTTVARDDYRNFGGRLAVYYQF